MNRRTFLTSMLAACAAPAIVRADSLMRIVARDVTVIPVEYGSQRLQQFVVTGFEGGNTLLSPAMAMKETLRLMHKNLTFVAGINRQFETQLCGGSFKVGDIISIEGVTKARA